MVTKVEAARIATAAGVPVVLTSAEPGRRRPRGPRHRHVLPPHRPPLRRPAAVARPRLHPAGRAHPGRRRRTGRRRAPHLAAARRDRRRRGRVQRRGPGGAARPARAARSPAGSSTSTPRRSRSCSAAPPATWPANSAPRTNARSYTGTISSSSRHAVPPETAESPAFGQGPSRKTAPRQARGLVNFVAGTQRVRTATHHRRPPVRRARPGASPRGTGSRALTQCRSGRDFDRSPPPGRHRRTGAGDGGTGGPPAVEAVAHHPQRLGDRDPAGGGQARPGTARPRPSLPADQPVRQRPRGDPLLGRGPRPARRGRGRAAAVGRAPLQPPSCRPGRSSAWRSSTARRTTSASPRGTDRRPPPPSACTPTEPASGRGVRPSGRPSRITGYVPYARSARTTLRA